MPFAKLAARSVATAHLLAELGLKRGDRILSLPLGKLAVGSTGTTALPKLVQHTQVSDPILPTNGALRRG